MKVSQQTDQIVKQVVDTVKSLHDVKSVYLFGSRSKMKERVDSDIDLIVKLDKDSDTLTVRDRMNLIDRALEIGEILQDVINVRVDALEMHELTTMKNRKDIRKLQNSSEIAESIEKEMVKIYERCNILTQS